MPCSASTRRARRRARRGRSRRRRRHAVGLPQRRARRRVAPASASASIHTGRGAPERAGDEPSTRPAEPVEAAAPSTATGRRARPPHVRRAALLQQLERQRRRPRRRGWRSVRPTHVGRARTAAGRRPATSSRCPRRAARGRRGRSRAATSFLPILMIGAVSLSYIFFMPSPSATACARRSRTILRSRCGSSEKRVVGALHRAVQREVLLDDRARRARTRRPPSRCRCRGSRSRRPRPGSARGTS